MRRRKIEYVDGVPRWFTRLFSWLAWRTRCRKRGHELTLWPTCVRCGEWVVTRE